MPSQKKKSSFFTVKEELQRVKKTEAKLKVVVDTLLTEIQKAERLLQEQHDINTHYHRKIESLVKDNAKLKKLCGLSSDSYSTFEMNVP